MNIFTAIFLKIVDILVDCEFLNKKNSAYFNIIYTNCRFSKHSEIALRKY